MQHSCFCKTIDFFETSIIPVERGALQILPHRIKKRLLMSSRITIPGIRKVDFLEL